MTAKNAKKTLFSFSLAVTAGMWFSIGYLLFFEGDLVRLGIPAVCLMFLVAWTSTWATKELARK